MSNKSDNLVCDYLQLTDEYINKYGVNTVVLMQVGSFYEVYALKDPSTNMISGSRLEDVCQICSLNYAEKKICVGESNVLMAGVRDYVLDKYLKILIENHYTAVVFVQEKTETRINRILYAIYSSGTYLSYDVDSSPKITNNIMCIWIERAKSVIRNASDSLICGISSINIFTGESYIFEYQVPFMINPTSFDELERCISVNSPSEVIFISSLEEKVQTTIKQFIGLNNSTINIVKPSEEKLINCEKQIYISKILSTFYGDESYSICNEFTDYAVATQSLCYLLDFIQEHNPNLVRKIVLPVFMNSADRVILANHTLQQLNIIDTVSDKNVGRLSSVASFLNQCCTSMGRRKINHQLTNPTTNIKWLQNEYNMIDVLMSNIQFIEVLRRNLINIKDLDKLCRQLINRKIYPNSLYYMHQGLHVIKIMIDAICENKFHNEILEYLNDNNNNNIKSLVDDILCFIDSRIHINDCRGITSVTLFDINIIKHGVSKELDDMLLRKQLEHEAFFKIHQLLNSWIRIHDNDKKNTEYVKCHETEKSGCTLQITKKRGQILKSYINNELKSDPNKQIHINTKCVLRLADFELRNASASMEEIYFPELSKICKNMVSVEDELNREISKIYNIFLHDLEELHLKTLEFLSKVVASLDVLQTKVYISKKYNYCCPTIVESNDVSFVEATNMRHCLIEHINQNELYVTNDILLDYTRNQNGILLYGTNAVGKTSLIRALGINIIMAQAGFFVSCSTFKYKPYKAMYSRILGNDNLFKGLSTFAVEMSELRVILKYANDYSLVLGDEVCSGTESVSALSIFATALQYLTNLKTNFIFATHFHELIKYEEITNITSMKMMHLSVIYDRETDCLIYDRKLKDGPGDSNYGLIVAKSLYLPEDFLENAYDFRRKYFTQGVVGELLHNTTKYNAKKIRGICEMCKCAIAEEIHHLAPQSLADGDNYIGTFHKNHTANLMSLCNQCHLKEHHIEKDAGKLIIKRRKKTTNGYTISEESKN